MMGVSGLRLPRGAPSQPRRCHVAEHAPSTLPSRTLGDARAKGFVSPGATQIVGRTARTVAFRRAAPSPSWLLPSRCWPWRVALHRPFSPSPLALLPDCWRHMPAPLGTDPVHTGQGTWGGGRAPRAHTKHPPALQSHTTRVTVTSHEGQRTDLCPRPSF